MSTDARQRALDKVTRLTCQDLDLVTLWRESTEVMATVVPHFGSPCWYTLDPASLLITSHFNDDMPVFPPEWLANEYYGDDVHKLVDLAHSSAGVSTLYEATDGKPWTSERWQENVKLGGDQELLARLQTRSGEVWGALGLYREPDRPLFDADDKRFVREASQSLAEGARRALLMAEAREPDSLDAPGLVVLAENWEVESTTPGVDRWLRDLPDGDWPNGRLPSAVLAVAGRVRRNGAHPEAADEIAVSRVRTNNGSWIVLYGAALLSNHSTRVAVILERAHPFRITPLLMSAYGLTAREQEVTRLVLRGSSTAEIARETAISQNTVQQHLKNVFAKTGVRSRRDLVGKVFFAHYEPRVRDNEERAADARPLRGGPAPRHGPTGS
ncbi:MAG: helix-turn-helix transcriptional regulator [Nocardioidaceae bacterium]